MSTQRSRLNFLIPALVLVASAYADPTISLEAGPSYGGSNPYQAQGGGEFTAFDSDGIPSGYASDALLTLQGQTGFETFCLLPDVGFDFANSYDFEISPYVYVPDSSDDAYAGSTAEPLSLGAAWLYSEFASGQLQGYDYADSNDAYSRLDSASDLQKALWYYQQQISNPNSVDASPDPFLALVEAQFGSDSAAMAAETTNEFGVNVIDAYVPDSGGAPQTLAQPTLIYTGQSVPDAASTAALLGGAVLALAWMAGQASRQRSLS